MHGPYMVILLLALLIMRARHAHHASLTLKVRVRGTTKVFFACCNSVRGALMVASAAIGWWTVVVAMAILASSGESQLTISRANPSVQCSAVIIMSTTCNNWLSYNVPLVAGGDYLRRICKYTMVGGPFDWMYTEVVSTATIQRT